MAKDQHFLIDRGVIEKELELLEPSASDIVLEVGPGLGTITKAIAGSARQVIAIEKDANLIFQLERTMPRNVLLIHDDALKATFPSFTKFFSNIPYSISLPLTIKLLRSDFSRGVIICQEEFAQKLVAKPGSEHYGRISVIAQYYASIALHDEVQRDSFAPPPKVSSRIVTFTKKNSANLEFEHFVTELFRHRRKKVYSLDKRAEALSPHEIFGLFLARGQPLTE